MLIRNVSFLLLTFSKVVASVKTISMHGYPEQMK